MANPIRNLVFVSIFIICVNSDPGTSKADPVPTENYPYHEILDADENYHLFWKFTDTNITFETHVRTKGYVGFGFSSNGKMYPGDVVVGWVKDGVTHFKDLHTVGHRPPIVDASQDWFLLHGEENDFGTVLKMVRKFDTCDTDDIKIKNDTIRGIYSYSPSDPVDMDSLPYHGPIHRGSKSLMLLTKTRTPTLPSDVVTKDFLNDNFEPVVEKGHESLVHHIVLYKCPLLKDKIIGHEYVCYNDFVPCGNVYLAWATGGKAFYYPDDVGMPIGEPGDNDVFVLETHYNNPALRKDYVDSSGMRIVMTPTLRHHDAGMLAVSMWAHPLQIIPPGMKDFRSNTFCTSDCLRKGLDKMKSGVKMFAVLQHAHLLGRGIRTRLYRNGTELEPIAYDEHYDFDYQEYRYLNRMRTLQSGDSIVVECRYDSTGRVNKTVGGFSTQDEMCVSFILYYPRMNVDMCANIPAFDNIVANFTQATAALGKLEFKNYNVVEAYLEKLNTTHYLSFCRESGPPIKVIELEK
ncbi:hypothetical protein FSP39_005971 [Pinctada imbricata]|uniref:DOMON domain-containing protein n=1 Tax=Pinctada imbricata TaxID=66713 RepID=A0AA88XTM0_PINIB|nr:hypothetical protein FSP39_005971 [Pinctada imbricata]